MAPEIVLVLATKEYYNAIYIMPPICAGIFLISLSNMNTNVLIYHKKTKFIMISSCVAATVNVILNYFGIKMFGYMAAAYTTLIAYMILALMQGVVSTRVHRKTVGDEKATVYDMKYIYMLAVVTIVLCTSCILLYQHTILRYCIIAVLIVLAVVFRNKILMLFKKK